MKNFKRIPLCLMMVFAVGFASAALAQIGSVTFHDVVQDGVGIDYERTPSEGEAIFAELREQPTFGLEELLATPAKTRGAPGVVLFDYDRDGDLDIYVTNGPGTANSLYSNQVLETGALSFVDVADAAGVGATEQDSSGVCFGDVDNDGYEDLLVLGVDEPNILFHNSGDGTFEDVTAASGLGGDDLASTSCSMGDVNADGLLDIAVVNLFPTINQLPMFVEPFALNEANQLFLNQGGNVFTDVSVESGFTQLDLTFGAPQNAASITWAVSLVDYDLDGDIDIIQADDQGVIPENVVAPPNEGIDRGYLQLFENDGTGHFTNVTYERRLNWPGGWMGFAFGDFNSDGLLDFFATNFGNHARAVLRGGAFDFFPENRDSRWFLGQENGTFYDASSSQLRHTPFGWGVAAVDYDNDADTDIIYQGGIDGVLAVLTAPAAVLNNDGAANFERDSFAFAGGNHLRRAINGMAAGDLNLDGFVDIVSVSSFDHPEPIPLTPAFPLGSAWDEDAVFVSTFTPIDPENFVFSWNGIEFPNGTLSVDVNSGNDNGWAEVEVMGTVGITSRGQVNRDGIGAVIQFWPQPGGDAVMTPVMGGSSYASQHSLVKGFGMGSYERAIVDVLWPGGVWNRFFNVRPGDRLFAPEIPCDFKDPDATFFEYVNCVIDSVDELEGSGVIDRAQRKRLLVQALRAFHSVN